MTLVLEILRGILETIRETLPGDQAEQRVFLCGFWVTLAIQVLGFALLAIYGTSTRGGW